MNFELRRCLVLAPITFASRSRLKLLGAASLALVSLMVTDLGVVATDEECTVRPRRTVELAALAKAPEGIARSLAGEAPVATPAPPPPGEPADPEVAASVAAAASELVNCYNAGDLRRIFALYSEEYLYRVWGGFAGPYPNQAQIDQAIDFLSTPTPQPVEDRIAFVSVDDVRVLPNGTVSAVVTLSSGSQLVVYRYTDGWYQLVWAYPLS